MKFDLKVEGLDDVINGFISQLAPRSQRVMRDAMNDVYSSAFEKWPVKTGESKRRLVRNLRLTAEGIEVTIEDLVPYAQFIREKRKRTETTRALIARGFINTTRGTSVTAKLITKPWRKRWDKIAQIMVDELIR